MRIHKKKTLQNYWLSHADAHEALDQWFKIAEAANWKSPAEVKVEFASVSVLQDNRLCFNIKGNTYRLIVAVEYQRGILLIKWIGTHAEYDKINADTVNDY